MFQDHHVGAILEKLFAANVIANRWWQLTTIPIADELKNPEEFSSRVSDGSVDAALKSTLLASASPTRQENNRHDVARGRKALAF